MEITIQTVRRIGDTVTLERFCVDCSIQLSASEPYTRNVQYDMKVARGDAIAYVKQLLANLEQAGHENG